MEAIVDVVDGTSPGSLTVTGSVSDGGLIKADSTSGDPTLTFEGPVTVQIGGTVQALGSAATIYFVGDSVDNSGSIGADQGTMLFQGAAVTNETGAAISATDSGIITFEQSTIVSTGTITANGGVVNVVDSTVENAGGMIEALGPGLSIQLTDATIKDGTMSIASNSVVLATGASAIDNVVINSSGTLETGGTLTLDGDAINGGVITGAGTGSNVVNIDVGSTLTLNGVTALGNDGGTGMADNAGTIVLENMLSLAGTGFTLALEEAGSVSLNGATIQGTNPGETLENNANTISGAGQLGNGNGDLTLQNDAAGNITAQGGTLNILASVVNDGMMIAANGAILNLAGAVSGAGSTLIDAGSTVMVGALDSQAVTFNGVGTLTINPTGNLTGDIDGLAQGDIIDFANNTSITSTLISGSTLTVDESSGGPLTYQIAGALAGNYFAIQSDNNGGDELVLSPLPPAPTVTALTDNVASGSDLDAGKTIIFTLATSEAVNATDAALTLSNGATASYTSGSGSETLTFTYTVAAGDASTADLKVTGYSGTLADTAGNALVAAGVSEDTGIAITTTAPTVTALTDNVASGSDLDAGKTIIFTLATSEAVNATDAALTLSNGATASYTSGSGSETLTFTYTVAAGDASTADLKVTGYSGTLADTAGNALVAAGVSEDTGIAITTTAPTVTALTDNVASGSDLDAGKTIIFTLATSEAVNATDAALTLSNGATASYTSGSGSETLTFTYTVAAGDASTADLKVTGYSGTLADTAGNALVAAGVSEDTGIAITTTAPTVTALTDNVASGSDLDAGKTIIFTLATSEAVNATDAALTLSNGATASYTSGSGSETLTFTYTVAAGDASTADLKVTGYSGTLADTAGNALVAAGVSEDTGIAITTTAPTVTALTDNVASGSDLDAGKTIIFTLATSEAVNATDAALTLSNGATASYTSGSGSETLTFTYTVAAGDASTADLKVTGYSGTLADTAGNALVAAGVSEDTGIAITTTAPTVTALTDNVASGSDLDAGKTIIFTLATSEAVNATDAALTLSNGATASYTSGSGSETLTFTYTVAAGDASTADLKVTGYSGTLADTAGNALVAAGVSEDTGIAITTTAPTVTALTDNVASGSDLDAGKTIIFTLATSEAVNATDAALTLSNGATASYTSGSGSETLTFTYTVAAGDASTADLKVTGYSGTLADTAGNALVAAGVSEDTGIAITTTAPTVTALTDNVASGSDLDAGKTIIFTLATSEAVNATDAALTLSNGATASYTSGSGSETLTFTYTVAAGDASTADLKVTGYSGTLADTAGNALVAAGVSEDTGIAITTTAPTVTALTDNVASGSDLDAGKTIIFTLATSEAVNATDAALTLSNGATASYTSGSGSETLTFTYTVAAGDASTADLKVTGYSGTLADTAGNALVAAGVSEDTGIAITTTAPTDDWINTSGGTWTDTANEATNWSDGLLPRSIDTVVISAAGSGPYTVVIPSDMTATAASLTLDASNATLSDQGALTLNGVLTIDAGMFQLSGSGTLGGETAIANAGTFEIAGSDALATSITNTTGTVQVDAGNTLTLSGASISGGTISITANGELLGAGVSAIDNVTIDNSGSLVTGGTLTLDGDTVDGGILKGAGGGGGQNIINIDAGDALTLESVTAQGNADGTGTVDNSGTILLENTLTLAGIGVALLLNDAGTLALNGATIAGSNTGETLENNANTISGTGQIGNSNGDLTLQNDAAGMITAQGGTLEILADVDNAGTMTAASGATLNLVGQISGTGSTMIDAGGTVVVGALDQQVITYDGVGTLQITPTGNLTGAIDGLVLGDVIDFANNTSIASTSISGSTLTVNESSGGPLTYAISGAIAGNYVAIQSDDNGGDELVLSPVGISVTASVVDNLPVQVGQTLVATATITGDTNDAAAPITYQWQISSNGGGTWTDVGDALAGNFDNGQPSSFLQLTAADQGDEFRVLASITDETDQTDNATSAPTTAVTDVTAEITPAFTYLVDDLSLVKNGTGIYNDTFSAAPPASPTIFLAVCPPTSCF